MPEEPDPRTDATRRFEPCPFWPFSDNDEFDIGGKLLERADERVDEKPGLLRGDQAADVDEGAWRRPDRGCIIVREYSAFGAARILLPAMRGCNSARCRSV